MTREERKALVDKQVKVLTENGIKVIDTKILLKMVIVSKADLDKASGLKISDEITIASRR